MSKSVLVYSYYSPEELTGIGKYNNELLLWLQGNKIEVISVSNSPFYPYWEIYDGFKNPLMKVNSGSFLDIRSYVYVPRSPSPLKKIISEISFVISSTIAMITQLRRIKKTDLIVVIVPPFFLGTIPIMLGKVFGISVLFHIQDLQVDAARELKLLPDGLCNVLERFEKILYAKADYLSTISAGMKKKIEAKLEKDVFLIPNWSNLSIIKPGKPSTWLHQLLGLDEQLKLIVYSGNIGEKQGLEIVLLAANLLKKNNSIHFVILGSGLYKNQLLKIAKDLEVKNLMFGDLVPKKNMIDMLRSSFLQLVIQKSEGADSFFPSKLANILSAGCASIITASKGTSLYDSIGPTGAAKLIEPDSESELSNSILDLLNDSSQHNNLQVNARKWAEINLDINNCLKPLLEII